MKTKQTLYKVLSATTAFMLLGQPVVTLAVGIETNNVSTNEVQSVSHRTQTTEYHLEKIGEMPVIWDTDDMQKFTLSYLKLTLRDKDDKIITDFETIVPNFSLDKQTKRLTVSVKNKSTGKLLAEQSFPVELGTERVSQTNVAQLKGFTGIYGDDQSVDWRKDITLTDQALGGGTFNREDLSLDSSYTFQTIGRQNVAVYYTPEYSQPIKIGEIEINIPAPKPLIKVPEGYLYAKQGQAIDLLAGVSVEGPDVSLSDLKIVDKDGLDEKNPQIKGTKEVYTIRYQATNKHNEIGETTRHVHVYADPIWPSAEIETLIDTPFDTRDNFRVLFRESLTSDQKDVTDAVTVESNTVNQAKEGQYQVEYKYKHNGLEWSFKRKVKVVKKITQDIPVTEVLVTPNSQTIKKNQVFQLKTSFKPLNASHTQVKWSSDNDLVAKVDSQGNVTGLSSGEAKITATWTGKDRQVIKASSVITVSNDTLAIGKLAYQPAEGQLEIGKTVTPVMEVTAAEADTTVAKKDIRYTSSDKSVATVNQNTGEITAVAKGEAIITATYALNSAIKTTYKVTVIDLIAPKIQYQTQVQNIGWQKSVENGAIGGTTGQSKRMETIKITLPKGIAGSVEYRSHVQNLGWEKDYVANGQPSGTVGQAKQMEAIQIRLSGEVAKYFDIYYQVHAQNLGWLDWAKNDEKAGSTGFAYRLEAIRIKLVRKNEPAPGKTDRPFVDKNQKPNLIPTVSYQTHVEKLGWQAVKENGQISGTEGQGKRLEGIKIKLANVKESGSIVYSTHVQNLGWQTEVKDNQLSGTVGKSLRLEAIKIKLTGQLAEKYDIYYRVHAQNFSWLGWAVNGEAAGTTGFSYRLEAIEIKLLEKNAKAPGDTARPFVVKK